MIMDSLREFVFSTDPLRDLFIQPMLKENRKKHFVKLKKKLFDFCTLTRWCCLYTVKCNNNKLYLLNVTSVLI